jgi:hypothetical protein
MANWTAPFHPPKYMGDDFEKQKAAYVAKYGYSVSIPGFEDIFHWRTHEPLSPAETASWIKKDRSAFSDQRWEEISEMKRKKKDRYLSMLASPTPAIVRNAGAFLTSLDDCQDALTTLSVVGRLAIRFAPGLLGESLLGPVGWILTAADLINVAMIIGRLLTMPVAAKQNVEALTAGSPFNMKARLKRAAKLSRPYPSISNLLEVAQTTDQVFGYGICLGPIVGFAQDFISGGIRGIMGQKVAPIKNPFPDFPVMPWAFKVPKSTAVLMSEPLDFSIYDTVDVLGANYLASQVLHETIKPDDLISMNPVINMTELRCPVPKNQLTLEVIAEEGIPLEKVVGWPHNNSLWAPTNDIVENYHEPAKSFLRDTMQKHEHDPFGWLFGNLMTESYFNTMSTIEGEDQMEYDYTERSRCTTMLLKAGYYPDPDQPHKNLDRMKDVLDDLDKNGPRLTTKGFLKTLDMNGILLKKM